MSIMLADLPSEKIKHARDDHNSNTRKTRINTKVIFVSDKIKDHTPTIFKNYSGRASQNLRIKPGMIVVSETRSFILESNMR